MKKKLLTPNNIYIIIILLLIILIISCYKCKEYFTEHATNKPTLTLKIKDKTSDENKSYIDKFNKSQKEYKEYVKLKTDNTILNVNFNTVVDSTLIKPKFEFTNTDGTVTTYMYSPDQVVNKIVTLLKEKIEL